MIAGRVSTHPTVSVLLPVRNAAATLGGALASVLASRGVSLELICVDDGSRDATPELLRAASDADQRVQVATGPARGIVAALNVGLRLARAPLVARMDADDEMHPDRLARQSAALRDDAGLALVGCRVESFREGGLAAGWEIYTSWVNGLVSEEAIAREAFVECPVPHPTWMFRRDIVRALGGYRDEPWPEDLDLLYRLMLTGARIGKIDAALHRWRDHEARLSRVDPRYGREAFARAKARFIPRIHPMPAAVVWGAGRTGRRWVRLLEAEGLTTRALIDIRPERIGTRWRGIPILGPDALPSRVWDWRGEGLRILCAVASRGARAEIRGELAALGLREGDDFLMVA
jgi:glycosyltransferase involved in cell wall biosynthesis